jgi:hypothetical protein
MKNLSCCLVVLVLFLSGCSTGNKFASSFGKRHYTKGYFLNRAGSGETVHEKTERETVNRNSVGAGNRKSETTLPLFDVNKNVVSAPALVAEKKRVGQGIAITKVKKSEVTSVAKVEDGDGPTGGRGSIDGKNEDARTGRIAIVFSSIFLLGWIIAKSAMVTVFPPAALLLLALLFVIIAIVSFSSNGKPAANNGVNSNPQQNDANRTNMGVAGFVLSLGGLILIFLDFILVVLALTGSNSVFLNGIFGTIAGSYLFTLLPFFMILIGFIISLVAIHHNDQHIGLARAGAIISGIILAIFLLLILASLSHI